jgi:dienelactone hydrolase
VHAFTQKEAGSDNSKGAAYNEAAHRRSWQHMQDLFKESL